MPCVTSVALRPKPKSYRNTTVYTILHIYSTLQYSLIFHRFHSIWFSSKKQHENKNKNSCALNVQARRVWERRREQRNCFLCVCACVVMCRNIRLFFCLCFLRLSRSSLFRCVLCFSRFCFFFSVSSHSIQCTMFRHFSRFGFRIRNFSWNCACTIYNIQTNTHTQRVRRTANI